LATTIIEEGAATMLDTFRAASRSSSPAMENIVHGLFMVTDVLSGDRVAQAASRLLRTFGGFNATAKQTYVALLDEMTQMTTSAVAEGDLRPGLDAVESSNVIVGAMLGAELFSSALADGKDLRARFTRVWEIMLPAIVSDESLGYYREFLARQSMRGNAPNRDTATGDIKPAT